MLEAGKLANERRSWPALLILVAVSALVAWGGPVNGTFYAVIVGVADYPGTVNDLKFTDDDAYAMYQTLLSFPSWSAERIALLIDSAATKANALQAMVQLTQEAGPDDVFLFYFSGHGTVGADLPPLDEADGRDEYLCTYGSTLAEFIRDDELETWLAALVPNRIMIILDSCFSGGAVKGVRSLWTGAPPREGDGFEADLVRPDAATRDLDGLAKCVVAMMAADDHEYAYELGHPFDHGLFTYFLLEAMRGVGDLNGDGFTTAEECFAYAAAGVQSVAGPYGLQQYPQLYDACPDADTPFLQENPPAVQFADRALEAVIREAIGKASGDIYDADLAGLTGLHAPNRSITELGGVEHCVGLTTLDLSGNRISDLAPLSPLTSLTSLLLDHNEISGIGPLALNAGLGTGDYLDVRWNALDLSPGSQAMGDTETLIGRGAEVQYEPQGSECEAQQFVASAAGWYMVSLPGVPCGLCQSSGESVCVDLACALGDDVNPFIAYHYDADLGVYEQVSPPAKTCYPSGTGVWIYIPEAGVRLDASVTLLTEEVEVELRGGWNQVGNPYSFDVGTDSIRIRHGAETLSLADAQQQGWASATLYSYDTAAGAYDGMAPTSGCVRAWTGCWIQAFQDNCTLVFHPVACTSGGTLARSTSSAGARASNLPPPPPVDVRALHVDGTGAGLSIESVPNPVRGSAGCLFRILGMGDREVDGMRIDIYDLGGQRVFTGEAALSELPWDGVNSDGEALANGVYLYEARVEVSGIWYLIGTNRLVVLR